MLFCAGMPSVNFKIVSCLEDICYLCKSCKISKTSYISCCLSIMLSTVLALHRTALSLVNFFLASERETWFNKGDKTYNLPLPLKIPKLSPLSRIYSSSSESELRNVTHKSSSWKSEVQPFD